MADDSNPYRSPSVDTPEEGPVSSGRNTGVSLVFIAVGAAFCVASAYLLYPFDSSIAQLAWAGPHSAFAFAAMVFYAFAGLFTCLFHATYLATGCPRQEYAGIAALGVSLVLTTVVVGAVLLVS